VIKIEDIFKWHNILIEDEFLKGRLWDEKKINVKDIVDSLLGWDKEKKNVIVPIRDENGIYVEILRKNFVDEGDWLEDIGKYYRKTGLVDSIKAKHYGKEIRFSGIVVGKDLSPYLIPKHIKIECNDFGGKEKCEICALRKGMIEYDIHSIRDREIILNFIGASDAQVNGFIRHYFKIPSYNTCRKVNLEITERQDVEEILLAAELDYERVDTEYVLQKAYVFSSEVKTNQSYHFFGTTWNDPRSQQSTHIINRIKPSLDSVAKWTLTPEIKKQLQIFQPKNIQSDQSIKEKINNIYKDFSANVTKICKRENVIMATELIYHSILSFNFLNDRINKGWMECLIIGDTRTGKTETVRPLIHHYKAGEFVTSGENVTIAGILGGVQQTHSNTRWNLTWGKWVLNDRGALTIDEMENLTKREIIGDLSGVRSSGIAEVVKIQTQKTFARTRIIFIANPLHGGINEYNFGIEIVKELFKEPQDVSRLDFAIMCAKEDVSNEEINQRKIEKVPHIYTSEICHNRVMFAWSRRPENIIWGKGTEDLILQISNELGKKYSPEIPLILGAEIRIKLARLTASLAAMLYSVDETGENLILLPSHVMVITSFLENQYANTVMGYSDYSEQKKLDSFLKDTSTLDEIINSTEIINMLLNCKRIQLQDIEDIFSYNREEAKKCLSILRKCRALKKMTYYYFKTSSFITFLKKERNKIRQDEKKIWENNI
jgi:hypothetical protein